MMKTSSQNDIILTQYFSANVLDRIYKMHVRLYRGYTLFLYKKVSYLTHLKFRAPAIFAHPNFRAINFRATSPFSRTINFRAMIFDSFFLLNFT